MWSFAKSLSTLVFQRHARVCHMTHMITSQSAVVCVSVCFELNDLWPRYLACWFILTLPTSSSKVKVKVRGHKMKIPGFWL